MAIGRRKSGLCAVVVGVVLAAGSGPTAAGTPAQGEGLSEERPLWRGPQGEPLPFRNGAEAVAFLRDATVVSSQELGEGSTRPRRLLIEKDGVQAHAIFRSFERRQERVLDPDTGQTRFQAFHDSFKYEAAAYDLATLLGLPLVPPAVRRVIDNRDGSVQMWIENAMSEAERQQQGVEPPDPDWWRGVLQTLVIFDNLIDNADRNTTNLIIDRDWRVWFIDHTRAFQEDRGLRNPQHITFCERRLFERLKDVTDEELRAAMAPHLDGREIGALLRRRQRLVAHIERLIEENGEAAVLFTYSYDLADWGTR